MRHPNSEQLNELIDNRLGEPEKRRLMEHLKECPSCSSAFRLLTLVDTGVRRQKIEAPGSLFVETLMKKIGPIEPASARPRPNRLLKFGSNLFALLVVLGLIYGAFGLARHYLPADSSAVKQIEELSSAQNQATGWWSRAWDQFRASIAAASPGGKFPLWLPAIWSIIFVFLIDRFVVKRIRRQSS